MKRRLIQYLLVAIMTANGGLLQSAQTSANVDERLNSVPKIPLTEIATDPRWLNFVPVAKTRLEALLRLDTQKNQQPDNSISRIEFSSRLAGTSLIDGTVSIELSEVAGDKLSKRLPNLGKTNLSNLKLYSNEQPIPLALRPDGAMVALTTPESTTLTGTWDATGSQPGRSVLFDLEIPSAAVSVFTLTTDRAIQITSPNSLVFAEQTGPSETTWKIYPNNRTLLTISCSENASRTLMTSAFVDVATDVRIAQNKTAATWAMSIPQQLSGCRADFNFSVPVQVTKVRLSDGTSVKWNVNPNASAPALEVFIPQITSLSVITVEAQVESTDNTQLNLPFIKPTSFSFLNEDRPGSLQLHSNTLRITIAPQIVVQNLKLNGLHERSVAYPADGSQVIDIVQHSDAPEAVVALAKSQAILTDAVVVKVMASESEIEATAYVNVSARTGTAGSVHWTIPAAWRVTEVRELNADNQPLLFRISADESSARQTQLEATLRTPLVAGANQSFTVKMQSIEGMFVSQRDPAALYTSTYDRQADFLVTTPETANPFADGWNTSRVSGSDLIKKLPWLPSSEFATTTAYERRQLASDSSVPRPEEEVFATVDYSLTENDGSIAEIARIRLRSQSDMPSRIPLLITSGIDVAINEESATRPAPTLQRISSNEGVDDWILEIPPDAQLIREIDFSLKGQRNFIDGMPAMVVMFDGVRRNGGTIQPPDSSSGFQLTLRSNEKETALTETVQYPSTNFQLNIRRTQIAVSQQIVSGQEFVILRSDRGRTSIESLSRCLIQSTSDRRTLKLKAIEADVRIFVNGRPAYAEAKGKVLQIPLPLDDGQVQIDVYTNSANPADKADSIQVPIALFPEADSSQMATFILTHADLTPTEVQDSSNAITLQPVNEVCEFLTNNSGPAKHDELAAVAQDFESRWMIESARSKTVTATGVSDSTGALILQITNSDSRLFQLVLWALGTAVTLLLTNALSTATSGIALFLLLLLQALTPVEAQPITHGIILGIVISEVCRWGWPQLRKLRKTPTRGSLTAKSASRVLLPTLLLFTFYSSASMAQDSQVKPMIVAPDVDDADFPLLYVDKSLLDSLSTLATPEDSVAAIVETQIAVTFESPGSAFAKISLTVATHEMADQTLPIPLDGVTLVDCSVDGVNVFPTQDQAGQTAIAIPRVSLLPSRTLSNLTSQQSARGPRQYGDWHLRKVDYTIRLTARSADNEYRLTLPYPPSPRSDVVLNSPSKAVKSATLQSQAQKLEGTNVPLGFRFPTIFNSSEMELSVRPNQATNVRTKTSQKARMVCLVDLDNGTIRTTSTFRVTPADPELATVTISTAPPYRILGVDSIIGTPLPWTAGDHSVAIKVAVDDTGEQSFVLRQVADTAVSLNRTIAFQDIAQINGQLPDDALLQIRTSDQFIIKSIMGDGKPFQQLTTASPEREAELSRTAERSAAVPPSTRSIEIELVERTATRVARLEQTVVVKDDTLDWKCQVEIDISGKPAFRQVLSISEDVRINNIVVTNGGATRLQSWTRSRDSVVISLREAARGILSIAVEGTLARHKTEDTSLPVIGFADDVEVLESTLELSAVGATQTFIKNLAGVRPNTPLDTSAAIPKVPLNLTVTDDARPLTLKASPDRRLSAEVVAVLYEVSGQVRMAIALAIDSSDNSSAVRFRKRSADTSSPTPIAKRNDEQIMLSVDGDIFAIPPQTGRTQTNKTIVILSDLIPVNRNNALTVQFPEFDSELEVGSCTAFDIRASGISGGDIIATFPKWAAESLRDLNFIAGNPTGRIQPCDFDTTTRRVVVHPAVRTENAVKASTRREALHVECEHVVHNNLHGNWGESGFLVFASQPDSDLRIRIPQDTTITRLRIDGTNVPIVVSRGLCKLSLPDRVCHVVMDWLNKSPQRIVQFKSSIPLPAPVTVVTQNRTCVLPPDATPLWWELKGTTENKVSYDFARTTSIMTGLRMVEEVAPTEARTTNTDTVPELPTALSEIAWQQLNLRSPQAAKSIAAFINQHSDTTYKQAELMTLTEPTIVIRAPQLPSVFATTVAVFAFLLMATSWIGRQDSIKATGDQQQESKLSASVAEPSLRSTSKSKPGPDDDVTVSSSQSEMRSATQS
ncbi:MAG: hypothetical protein WAO83_03245 [Fuerstiella sp.]